MKEKSSSKEIGKTLLGLVVLFAGFYLMGNVNLHIGYAQEFTLLVFSSIAVAIIFGRQALTWFSKPQGKYIRIIIGCIVFNAVWSMLAGGVVQAIFGEGGTQGNSAVGNYLLLFFVPFMLMGEELFSIGILETLRTKWGLSTLASTLLTAVIFGLIHFNTYNGGNVVRTLVHILVVQGVGRLVLNYAYLKTRSIWASYAVHLIFDLFFLFVLPLFLPM